VNLDVGYKFGQQTKTSEIQDEVKITKLNSTSVPKPIKLPQTGESKCEFDHRHSFRNGMFP
jgi:hypothetical protein